MEVKRTQYPIGQGSFHAGHLEWTVESSPRSEKFHYVYDCGTSDGSTALQNAILACRSETSHIDALFVSHLDADHVNGLDRLLGLISVHTVYIPYVSAVAPVLEIIETDVEGAGSASLIEALMDPVSWFGRRVCRASSGSGHRRMENRLAQSSLSRATRMTRMIVLQRKLAWFPSFLLTKRRTRCYPVRPDVPHA